MNRRRVFIAISVVVVGWILLWLGIANPFNFFVPRSENFSMQKFKSFGAGDSISAAVATLGAPVATIVADAADSDCPSCVRYCFLGEPPRWVIGFQEAWLIADQDGKIVRSFFNTEP